MTPKRNQLSTTLLQFYDKPVAKVSLELFFTITTVIIFALFAIKPTLTTMSNLIKELEDKRELNKKLSQKSAALQTLQGEYQGLEERLQVLDKAIPPTPQFDEAIAIIEKIASDLNLSIRNMQAKEVPKEPHTPVDFSQKVRVTRPVVVTVSGTYPTIRQFVENLRQSQRTLLVDSVIFATVEERSGKTLRAIITVNVPYYGIDPLRGNTATPSGNTTGGSTN